MPTPIVPIFDRSDYDDQIRQAGRLLSEGKLVVLPTETVYGISASLTQAPAMARLRALRPDGSTKPPTIHLPHRDRAKQFIASAGEMGERMMKKLWPGPVALIFDVPAERRTEVAANFKLSEADIYEHGAITLRCPDHIVAIEVLAEVSGPVVAIGAGLTSGKAAQKAEDFARELDGKVDLILDAGQTRYSKSSTILKVKPKGYEIVRAGIYDDRLIQRLLRTTILFVCSGNTCRSPMAEALTRHMIAEKLKVTEAELENKGITVASAGSFAMPGSRATPQAVEAVKELGADLSRHRSRTLSVELIHQADVVFTMSKSHAQAVMALVPSAADKVTTLDPEKEIDDPIGGDEDLYRQLAGQMQTLIEKRLAEKVPL